MLKTSINEFVKSRLHLLERVKLFKRINKILVTLAKDLGYFSLFDDLIIN